MLMRLTATIGCLFILGACAKHSQEGATGANGGTPSGGGAFSAGGAGGMPPGGGGVSASGGTSAAGGSTSGGTPGSGAISGATVTGASAGGVASGGAPMTSTGGGTPGSGGATTTGGAANGGGTNAGGAGGAEPVSQLAVTADFLNQTLSVVDVGKLVEGSKREDALVGTVDLKKYLPGPLDLAITPDGKTALVSISGGWLGAFTTVPPGNGTLLFVDIATRAVVGELYTGASPMGIVITKDGKRAFVGQYSETYFAVVDIAARTFTRVQTGADYNEELAIDDTGTVALLTYGPAGNAVTFSVDAPTNPLGVTLGLTGDAGGTAFFPGTKLAYVVQAPTALTGNVGGHNVVDVTNPGMPVASDNVRTANSPIWYPVTAVAARASVAFPSTLNNQLSIVEMKLDGSVAKQVQSVTVGPAETLAYGVTADATGRVFAAVPKEHNVAVVDLNTGKGYLVPWNLTQSGPNDIKLVPPG
jgi:hypothetical protein